MKSTRNITHVTEIRKIIKFCGEQRRTCRPRPAVCEYACFNNEISNDWRKCQEFLSQENIGC